MCLTSHWQIIFRIRVSLLILKISVGENKGNINKLLIKVCSYKHKYLHNLLLNLHYFIVSVNLMFHSFILFFQLLKSTIFLTTLHVKEIPSVFHNWIINEGLLFWCLPPFSTICGIKHHNHNPSFLFNYDSNRTAHTILLNNSIFSASAVHNKSGCSMWLSLWNYHDDRV
jgi:hypothetical protein